MVEPTKVCKDCGERKPWSSFWAKAKWEDGSMRQPHSYCKPCHQARTNEWERKKRAADPEWRRRRGQRNRERIRSDPDRYAESLAYRREWARKRYGYRRDLSKGASAKEKLTPAPFVTWMDYVVERDETSINDLAARWGISDKTLREIRNGKRSPSIETVERALIADDTIELRDLYPHLYCEAA